MRKERTTNSIHVKNECTQSHVTPKQKARNKYQKIVRSRGENVCFSSRNAPISKCTASTAVSLMITANELVENINPLVFLITPWLVNALARLFRDPMRPIKCSASAAGSPIRFVSIPTRQQTHIYSQSSSIDFIILDLSSLDRNI